ncbi:TolC family protein [Bacteroides sp.]|uniref:TolC family protein n=1 Tax=Bacteroides sp. TaxID=29523 RepID=UPI0023CC00D5|nr:TolC family protein [Bacteroides sp.]MDE6215252.1 TolC family protein [Bacteroides sp.]
MQRNILLLWIAFHLLPDAFAQEQTLELTLGETIEQARRQSPDAQNARHSLRSAYWNYKYYCANYLPTLTLTSNPYLDRAINKVTQSDGNVKFVEQNLLSTDLTLSLTQNVPWTGGTFFVETAAQRLDLFSSDTYSWQTSPINVGYRQSLFGYNSLKWDRRIEPIRYREAKKTYVETLELVAARATEKFFSLAKAQSNYETANANYANADTLYIYAQGRYNIGTISENEMLQLELNKLTEETNCMNARIEVENCMQELRSYLGIQEDLLLQVKIDSEVPDLHIDLGTALMLANENSPEIQNMLRRKMESESAVARAKANAGLKADIYLRFGLTQTADKLKDAYRDPLEQQYVSLGITLPILDWGRGRGQVRVARSNRDLVHTQVEQDKTDFDLNVRKLVKQFNLQAQRVSIAARTDNTAQRRAEVARKLYLLGKSSILDLNASVTEKDAARRNYISALHNFWSLYYTLRSITLYDFEKRITLTEDLENVINNKDMLHEAPQLRTSTQERTYLKEESS